MNCDTFHLICLDEGGVQKTGNAYRLVCQIENAGKLAIWGDEDNMANIDKVLKAGFPCTVKCQWRPPKDWGRKHGHTRWVPEYGSVEVLQVE